MIRHIVLVKFRPDLTAGDVADILPGSVTISDIVGREQDRPVTEIEWDIDKVCEKIRARDGFIGLWTLLRCRLGRVRR